MGTSEENAGRPKLTDQELIQLWGVSWPYVIKLRREKGMPPFMDPAEADAWRAIHAPPRGRRQIGKNRVEVPPQLPPGTGAPEGTGEGGGESSPPNISGRGRRLRGEIINIKKFIKQTDDFDGLMLRQAEAVPQIAYGLLQRAAATGDTVEVSSQLKNWGDAGKVAGQVREKFLQTQEKSRALLSLDEVEDVVGTGLQEVRNGLLKHGERVAAALVAHLSPDQVALVHRLVDEDVDTIFRKISAVPDRARRELVAS